MLSFPFQALNMIAQISLFFKETLNINSRDRFSDPQYPVYKAYNTLHIRFTRLNFFVKVTCGFKQRN